MTRESDSIAAVAYTLFERVAYAEKKDIGIGAKEAQGWERADKRWILSTFTECLRTVKEEPTSAGRSFEAHEKYAGFREVPREAILASDPV